MDSIDVHRYIRTLIVKLVVPLEKYEHLVKINIMSKTVFL